MTNSTVGKKAWELLQKPDSSQGVIDTQREMCKKYLQDLEDCVKRYPDWKNPWYVCVQLRRERTLVNVLRSHIYGRQTEPSPEFDLHVYKYHPNTGDLEFLWCIPDKETFEYMTTYPHLVPSEEHELLSYCMKLKNKQHVIEI